MSSFGLTKDFPCSYLEGQQERLIMLIEPQINASSFYGTLLENGFRRSGEQVYRPHCQNCHACHSLRIATDNFKKSRSQKRLFNKNKHLRTKISKQVKDEYFALYQSYINQVHQDGPMYPAVAKQYEEFILSSWHQSLFIEIYDQDKLIAVSVTDQLESADDKIWSAFYCFYDPDYLHCSLGKYALLQQLALAKQFDVKWLYLGYYIKECQKMNYKNQFNPHQRFINGQWLDFDKMATTSTGSTI